MSSGMHTEAEPTVAIHETVRKQRAQRWLLGLGVGVAAAAVMAIVLLSPFALSRFAVIVNPDEWSQLSDVGQTYGAVSALISALAIGGVAATLLLQGRQARSQTVQTVRGLHFELTRIALEKPELYIPCWRPLRAATLEEKQQHLYQNLLISWMWMNYDLTRFPDAQLRTLFSQLFLGAPAREYWRAVENGWLPTYAGAWSNRRGRRFYRILTEEFERAEANGDPTMPRQLDAPTIIVKRNRTRASAVVVGAILGSLAAWVYGGAIGLRRRDTPYRRRVE